MLAIKPIDSAVNLLRESFASVGFDRVTTRLGIALLSVSTLFFAANFADKAWVSYQVSQQKQALIAQIQQTEQQIAASNAALKYMQTRPYYTEAARTYGFIRPGDIPISISASSAPPAPTGGAVATPGSSPARKPNQDSVFRRILDAIVPGF